MEADFPEAGSNDIPPAFLYITGDCVYFNGEVSDYYTQFYEPYEFYPAPIFAVPGNHDGDNVEGDSSLNGFVRNFCAPKAVQMPEAQDSTRTAMTQPNVYWTLLTPLVNIIGLYSNVPEGGDIRAPQTDWLINELKTLPKDIPIFLALHHPIFSADDHHSGSVRMRDIIDEAIQSAGRSPEAVLAGHVHDYQRLTQDRKDGTKMLYLITGAGGYHNLHSIQKVDGEKMVAPVTFSDHNSSVTLEKYSDDHHGFLRVELSGSLMTGKYFQVPRPQDSWSKPSQLIDYFEFDLVKRSYQPNKL